MTSCNDFNSRRKHTSVVSTKIAAPGNDNLSEALFFRKSIILRSATSRHLQNRTPKPFAVIFFRLSIIKYCEYYLEGAVDL